MLLNNFNVIHNVVNELPLINQMILPGIEIISNLISQEKIMNNIEIT